MKTTIRTYHPIPALSRTDGNLQDAPRIKHVLKGSLLVTDVKSTPATPSDILARNVRRRVPYFVSRSHVDAEIWKAALDECD
jgi:Ino eighty subunit 1